MRRIAELALILTVTTLGGCTAFDDVSRPSDSTFSDGDGPSCMHKTCDDYPGSCGNLDDGCGGSISCDCTQGSCLNGSCGTCPSDWQTCGTQCVNLTDDPNNCNGCGNACPTGANSTALCVSSVCQLQCDADFKDCNNASFDGCEAHLACDARHCGDCGTDCGLGWSDDHNCVAPADGCFDLGGCVQCCAPSCAPVGSSCSLGGDCCSGVCDGYVCGCLAGGNTIDSYGNIVRDPGVCCSGSYSGSPGTCVATCN